MTFELVQPVLGQIRAGELRAAVQTSELFAAAINVFLDASGG
jgi:hypothetical protein